MSKLPSIATFRRRRSPAISPVPFLSATRLLLLTTISLCVFSAVAVELDIHIPVSSGCPKSEALRANLDLRQSAENADKVQDDDHSAEEVDLFTKNTPHVTLFLADFDLEADDLPPSSADAADGAADEPPAAAVAALELNETKVQSFLDALGAVNFTEIGPCNVTFDAKEPYAISGPYVMIHVVTTKCLQTLSNAVVAAATPFVKTPVIVPDWVGLLKEPDRSAAILRSRTYGSPNVGDGFEPHVTVGYNERLEPKNGADVDVREEVMKKWKRRIAAPPVTITATDVSGFEKGKRGPCTDEAYSVHVGRTGRGGTVIQGSMVGSFDLPRTEVGVGWSEKKTYQTDAF